MYLRAVASFGAVVLLSLLVSSPAVADEPIVSVSDSPGDGEVRELSGFQQQATTTAGTRRSQTTYRLRTGVTGNYAASEPNFFGLGLVAEPTVVLGGRVAVGARLDGAALLGFGVTDRISVGARAVGGLLGKTELLLPNPVHRLLGLGTGETEFVLGAAGGVYRIGSVAGSVSKEVYREREDGVSGLAVGGRALGLSPQVGIQKGRVRVSAVSTVLYAASEFEPVLSLELAFRLL